MQIYGEAKIYDNCAECRKIDLQYGYVFIDFLKEGGISNCR